MQEIKKIDIISLAKIEGALGVVIGFIVGIIFAVIGAAAMGFAGVSDMPRASGLFFGVAAIIILPILCAVIGFIGGLIVAFLYNVVAGWIGGIEIELEPK